MTTPTFPRFAHRAALGTAVMASLLGLGGCNDDATAFAPGCPRSDIPSEAADYFDYSGTSTDLRTLLVHASLSGLTGDCEDGPTGKGSVRSRMTVRMHVTRGPANHTGTAEIPFFVAVTHNGKIIDKKIFSQTVTFTTALSETDVTSRVLIIDLPDAAREDPDSYGMDIGFQLSPGQLTYNRAHLPAVRFKQL
ncbi:hypothetical protein AA103196_1615 [Ameyamaea chiangmaiensis NBRC 103196]|uniref:Uncharacterized protein n=1 Tax=Ameyamaea chiangmaiensis TaxID=442969 RepID=A0A850P6Z3_9PROT|nr:hypothetical protein [Ameyamaea chiangmaiensis]MBS4076140.1 hypothetical protein [Ameyamaea chiangmaiensis]NVN39654.1 hypothetical protein [Ameyamaea chiangmaiensis]GBQ67170.1 hypothetical protein AA103196_1615 [Ameyamaea chiangmaiensis NBRC 103196]